jgi:transposase
MAYNFLAVERDQQYLMPPSVTDWLEEDHLAFFVLDAVDEMDLDPFDAKYRQDGCGAPAHDPKMMVALLVHAYCLGVRSSRQIERACHVDVAFRVVAANQTPDHTTIVAEGRGFDTATVLLDEECSGTLVRDGWVVHRSHDKATHQTCIAHLLRRCVEMETDVPDWARGTPRQVKEILLAALDARELPARRRRAVACDLAQRIELLAEAAHSHDANRRLVEHLTNEADALVSFLDNPNVDATNWQGEQPIRPAVVHRKMRGGRGTWRGAVTQGRITSTIRTAAQHGIDPIDFLIRPAPVSDPDAASLSG